jgi:hypothetical protein
MTMADKDPNTGNDPTILGNDRPRRDPESEEERDRKLADVGRDEEAADRSDDDETGTAGHPSLDVATEHPVDPYHKRSTM